MALVMRFVKHGSARRVATQEARERSKRSAVLQADSSIRRELPAANHQTAQRNPYGDAEKHLGETEGGKIAQRAVPSSVTWTVSQGNCEAKELETMQRLTA